MNPVLRLVGIVIGIIIGTAPRGAVSRIHAPKRARVLDGFFAGCDDGQLYEIIAAPWWKPRRWFLLFGLESVMLQRVLISEHPYNLWAVRSDKAKLMQSTLAR